MKFDKSKVSITGENNNKVKKIFLNSIKFGIKNGNESAILFYQDWLCDTIYNEEEVYFKSYILISNNHDSIQINSLFDITLELIKITVKSRAIKLKNNRAELTISEEQDDKLENLRELLYVAFLDLFLQFLFFDDKNTISDTTIFSDSLNKIYKEFTYLIINEVIKPSNSKGGINSNKKKEMSLQNMTKSFQIYAYHFCYYLLKPKNEYINKMQLLDPVDLTLILGEELLSYHKDAVNDGNNLFEGDVNISIKGFKEQVIDEMLVKIKEEIRIFEGKNNTKIEKLKYKIIATNSSSEIKTLLKSYHGVLYKNELYYNPMTVLSIEKYRVIYKEMQKIKIDNSFFHRYANSNTRKYTVSEMNDPDIISSILSLPKKSYYFKQDGFYPLTKYEYFTQSDTFFAVYNNCRKFFNSFLKRVERQKTINFEELNIRLIELSDDQLIKLKIYHQKYECITE